MQSRLFRGTLLAAFTLFSAAAISQDRYQYSVDLNKVENDQITVELICPPVTKQEIMYYLPKIVPGTYMNSNFGKYVHNLEAFDKAGKSLAVKKEGDNGWRIKNARSLHRIRYKVEDTWDAQIQNMVYPMAGTNFEANKNFVINTCGVFGYLDDMKKVPFEVNFTKPSNFYAATGLKPVRSSSTEDIFHCATADELYDSPIMFSLPDTTVVKVGKAEVLVAVYSPTKKATSKFIAANLHKLLVGTKDYLGGKLPVDKYAFLFYFNSEQKPFTHPGAWEHSYSSFYSLEEEPQEKAIGQWIDISAHEFFHIVTPLTISSKEVKEFNFNETNLSKHVWLYEGSTEYYSHHMQVWAGLKTQQQFVAELAQKIMYSRVYFKDDLSFTELSRESAGKWKEQYVNVYMKGCLISACIDLKLLQLSDGRYGLKELKHDLGTKYGKDAYFQDEELFDAIAKLSYPEIKDFLVKYVDGSTPIPYEEYFSLAGIDYLPSSMKRVVTMGGIDITDDSTGRLIISTKKMNEFGKKMGYQEGDQLISINGQAVNLQNMGEVSTKFSSTTKEGDQVSIVVKRNGNNVTLSAPAMFIDKEDKHVLRFNPMPTPAQWKIRKAWMGSGKFETPEPVASSVSSIDSIITNLYAIISGPAGIRDWNRFRSLLHPDAYMAAMTPKKELRKFTPEEYIQRNGPFFQQFSFEEKEIGRTVNQFGNIAQVFTAYQYKAGTQPPAEKRGINSIELVKEKGRWWIMSITWDEESAELPIPAKYSRFNKD